MESTKPKVSICIPTYNHAQFLVNAIDSALAQTFADFELLVVDNNSTDNTQSLVEDYCSRDKRIRYVRNDRNLGSQNNFNRCIELASGEYIKLLCSDDIIEPSCVEELILSLVEHPECSLAGSSRIMTDSNLKPLKILSFADRLEHVSGDEATRRCLRNGNLIGEPTAVLFRKKDAEGRGFNTKYRQLIDLEMWFYLLQKGGFAYNPKPLSRFRRHGEQETRKNIRVMNLSNDSEMILKEYVDTMQDSRQLYRRLWIVQAAFDIWAQQFTGVPVLDTHQKIRELVSLPLFYSCLPFKVFNHLYRSIKGRLALSRLSIAEHH